jgi:hypothetical protein
MRRSKINRSLSGQVRREHPHFLNGRGPVVSKLTSADRADLVDRVSKLDSTLNASRGSHDPTTILEWAKLFKERAKLLKILENAKE